MNPEDELLKYKLLIDRKLASYFVDKKTQYKNVSPFVTSFLEYIEEFTLRGGKRLRPALIYYTYKAFGGQENDKVVTLSIFIELIQSFLLIHDDIMDHADLRRGGKTVHKIYESYANEKDYSEPEHFGITMAILAGDLANQLAFELVSDSELENKDKLLKLLKLFTSQLTGVVFGQVHDILLTYQDSYTQEDIFKVHHYKTAKYTYEIPVISGAILAGATQDEIDLLTEFSTHAGIAFQIFDDILGVFGNDENTGKPTLSDIKEGKKTLLTLKAHENGDTKQKEILDKYLGKKDLKEEEAEEIREVMRNTGALEFSNQKCHEFVTKAQSYLDRLNMHKTKEFEFLYKIAEYSISRNK